jgi:hypothetical protein
MPHIPLVILVTYSMSYHLLKNCIAGGLEMTLTFVLAQMAMYLELGRFNTACNASIITYNISTADYPIY